MSKPELIIIDCDGVLYDKSELDINAILYAFNKTCDNLGLSQDTKFNFIEDCTQDKPVKGVYNYINYVSNKIGIPFEDFIQKIVEHIDYSGIQLDKEGILEKLNELQQKFKICICSNNHLTHINKVLEAKFNITAKQLPFDVFDTIYAQHNNVFYQKESEKFISKLELQFNIEANRFLWLDDSPRIIKEIQKFGSETILVTPENPLINILNTLNKSNRD